MSNGRNEESLLFVRGGVGDEADAWDDSALVRAYDQALARARNIALGSSSSAQPQAQNAEGDTARQWRVGDDCLAVWSEDARVYRARVISVDGEYCVVEFVDYGNSERQRLADLLPTDARLDEGEEEEDVDDVDDDEDQDEDEDDEEAEDADTRFIASAQSGAACGNVPAPPPMPQLPAEAAAAMDEATYRMLMSWYLSGYYTGYFVGSRGGAARRPSRRKGGRGSGE